MRDRFPLLLLALFAPLAAAQELVAPPPVDQPIRVAVISDLNGSYGSTVYRWPVDNAVERIVALRPDVVLCTGDMVAGMKAGLDYRGMWRSFHAHVTDPITSAGIPFAPTPGNHDGAAYLAYARERRIYGEQWTRRKPALRYLDDSRFPLMYSFVMGSCLFVSLDATKVGRLSSSQRAWIERQLVAARDYPVKVVYGHVPLYPFAIGRENDYLGDLELEAMLRRHHVTAFISGHHHAYYPGKRGDLRLVSLACLGSGQRPLLGTSSPSVRSFVLFDATSSGLRDLDAYTGVRFDQAIDRRTLPPQVGSGSRTIVRDDR